MKIQFWILLLIYILSLLACDSEVDIEVRDTNALCSNGTPRVVGSGDIITKSLSLDSFRAVINLQGADLTISQGTEQMVTVTGHANIIDKIIPATNDETWTVLLEEGCYTNAELTVDVTLPQLNRIVSQSSGNVIIEGFDDLESLEILSRGSGNITASVNRGTIGNLVVESRGGGDLRLYEFKADECVVVSAGSGDTFVQVKDQLEVSVQGSGNVSYKGSPLVDETVTGSGSLINAN